MTFRLPKKPLTTVRKNIIEAANSYARRAGSIAFHFFCPSFCLLALLSNTFCRGQGTFAEDWSNRSQRTTVRTSAETASQKLSGLHRGSLQWRAPSTNLFGGNSIDHQMNVTAKPQATEDAHADAFRQSIQQQLSARSVIPVRQVSHPRGIARQDQGTEDSNYSPVPASPWEDDPPPRQIVDDAFQDPFGDRAAPSPVDNRPIRPSPVQVKFKLDDRPVAAGFQRLEDLLLDDEEEKKPLERTPGPNDSFSPGVPVQPEDLEPEPDTNRDELPRDELPPPPLPTPDVDEISPFESEIQPPQLGSPLDLNQPDQDDSLRLPESETEEQPFATPAEDDRLTPPPIPDNDFRSPAPSRDADLPELRFRDEPNEMDGSSSELDDFSADVDDESAFKELPCDRNYNDRNCCQEDGECVTVLKRVGQRPVEQISLDLTPPFNVDESGVANDKGREEKLASVPFRTWTSREGQVLAEGKLSDFRNGRIIVANEDGQHQGISFNQLSRDDLCFVTAHWNLPAECPTPGDNRAFRDFTMLTYAWTASALCHKPLYFENVSLERYGHSAGPVRQPLLSAAHFFGSVILLPYTSKLYPPTECQYALGYYEPGDCAPWLIHAFPLSKRAALGELSFALGLWGFAS